MNIPYATDSQRQAFGVSLVRIIMNGGDIMFGLGMQEMLLIGVVLLLLFGPSKIPELMRSVGKGITEFKRGVTEAKDAVQLDERMKP